MAEQLAPKTFDIKPDIVVDQPIPQNGAMAIYGLLIFAKQAAKLKNSVAEKGVEVKEKQNKIKFIQKTLKEINEISNDKGFDLTLHPQIQESLKIAREYGVEFDETKLVFSAQDRDFLKESMMFTTEDLNDAIKLDTEKMRMLIQEADRWIVLADVMVKSNKQITKSYIDKFR